jgi:hypothetical protein
VGLGVYQGNDGTLPASTDKGVGKTQLSGPTDGLDLKPTHG